MKQKLNKQKLQTRWLTFLGIFAIISAILNLAFSLGFFDSNQQKNAQAALNTGTAIVQYSTLLSNWDHPQATSGSWEWPDYSAQCIPELRLNGTCPENSYGLIASHLSKNGIQKGSIQTKDYILLPNTVGQALDFEILGAYRGNASANPPITSMSVIVKAECNALPGQYCPAIQSSTEKVWETSFPLGNKNIGDTIDFNKFAGKNIKLKLDFDPKTNQTFNWDIARLIIYQRGGTLLSSSSISSSISSQAISTSSQSSQSTQSLASSSSSSQTTSTSQSSSQSLSVIQPPVSTPIYISIPENNVTFSPDRAVSLSKGTQDIQIKVSGLTYLDPKYKCELKYKPYPSTKNSNALYSSLGVESPNQNGEFIFNYKKELQTSSVVIFHINCRDFSRTGGDSIVYIYYYEGYSTYNFRVGILTQVEITAQTL